MASNEMLPGLGDTSGDEFSPSNSLKVFEMATMFRQSMILLGLIYHEKKNDVYVQSTKIE